VILEEFATIVRGKVTYEKKGFLFWSRTVPKTVDLVCDGVKARLDRGERLSFELPEITFSCILQKVGRTMRDPLTGEAYPAPNRKSWHEPPEGCEYVQMVDDAFNDAFALYTSDAAKAKDFFNPRLQHAMLAFRDWANENAADAWWGMSLNESSMELLILDKPWKDLDELLAFYEQCRTLLAAARD